MSLKPQTDQHSCLVSNVFPSGVLRFARRQVLRLGRGPENDIVLPHRSISRRHARVVWRGDHPYLRDLGSANGTHVNGQLLDRDHPLTDRDVIRIGAFQIGYRVGAEPFASGWEEPVSGEDTAPLFLDDTPETASDGDAPLLEGFDAPADLIDACLMVRAHRQCAVLEVESQQACGQLVFHDGELVAARCGELQGQQAARKLLLAERGLYEVQPVAPTKSGGRPMCSTLAFLEEIRVAAETEQATRRASSTVVLREVSYEHSRQHQLAATMEMQVPTELLEGEADQAPETGQPETLHRPIILKQGRHEQFWGDPDMFKPRTIPKPEADIGS